MSEDRFQLLRLLEAMLFASASPLEEKVLAARLPEGADLPGLLQELGGLYANRGVQLMQFEDRWAFRTAPDLAERLQIETTVMRKLSRAAVETLAIIAYHQPVTRAEVEEIRGVALSRGTLDTLLEVGWIRPKGRRQTPGRPVTWVTTDAFLDHFGLESCDALPGVEELRAAGLLDARSAISTLGARAMAAIAPREPEVGEGDDPEGGEGGTSADFETLVDRAEAAIEDEEEDGPSRG
jgi:segregation and condensation protein B